MAALLVSLAACSVAPDGEAGGIHDPYEERNRATHEFNKDLDRAIFRPASRVKAALSPGGGPNIIGNFSDNLGLPGVVVNNLLQGDGRNAGLNTLRFIYNTTFGIGGLFDPATEFGIPVNDTDFGETLHVWGAREGAYVELPVLGPSTERDTVGMLVDFVLDPMGHVLTPRQSRIKTGIKVLSRVGDRGRFGDTVDSVLYDSADSYTQTRLIYLQNRRFELGQEDAGQEIDPYALDTEGF